MKPTTAWGNKLLAASWWDTGMRGHFTRLSNSTGPEDMEFAIRAIEDEAREEEHARIIESEMAADAEVTRLLAEVDRLTALISCPACGQPGSHGIVGPFPNSTAGSDHRFQVAVLTNPWTGERLTDDRIERLRRGYAAIDGEPT